MPRVVPATAAEPPPYESRFATACSVHVSVPTYVALDFRLRTPDHDRERQPPDKADTVVRVYLPPLVAKHLQRALTEMVAAYENAVGEIPDPGAPGWVPPGQR